MTEASSYFLHGLSIASDLELAAPRSPLGERTPDLTVRRGPDADASDALPEGRLVAETMTADGGRFYSVAVADGTTVLRFHGLCDFVFSPAGDSVEWRLHRGSSADLAAVMATGTMIAVALVLGGHLVLHASAVAVGTDAVAFVGQPGRGKSTLAALACDTGCRLVTDDVLRVDGAKCHLGSTQARLRPGADFLEELFVPSRSQRTVDGRVAVALEQPDARLLDLRAVVIPRPDPSTTVVGAERLTPARAVMLLSRFPRLPGWQDAATNAAQFHGLVDLTAAVPVWRVRIPWPPAPADTILQLLDAIGLPQPCARS